MTDRKDRALDRSAGRAAAAASAPGEIDRFLGSARQLAPLATGQAGRLVFALDATMSRQPTWDLACSLQARMFETAAAAGGLAVQLVYFRGLEGNVLDASESAVNTVDIDEDAQKDYITLLGLDKPENLSVQQIREYNTGTHVYLTGRVTPVNAMEDLKVTFLM